MTEHRVRLGVIGHGTVGAAFVRLVKQQSDTIAARSGVRLEVARVAVRNIDAHKGSIAAEVMTTDAEFVVNDPTVDLVVELMGGVELPRKLILAALKSGKPVVTANKALLAHHGAELFAAADDAGIDLLFEAAVCGGIPLIRPLRESLRGEPIKRVLGIVNGTTNYILTKMSEEGQSYADALAGAQSLGYAEADPTADVEGLDAAAKVSIIASIAFGCNVVASDVYSEGISKISAADIAIAKRLGYAVKLLAIAEYDKLNGEVSVRVHPVMLHKSHPLASVRDAYNAVFVEAESAGSLMFYGRGAGGAPTASAILGDVVAVARHIALNSVGQRETDYADRDIAPIESTKTKFLIRLEVADKAGVLAAIATTFANHGVSIQTVNQSGRNSDAEVTIVTHLATEGELKATVATLKAMDIVNNISSVIRVEGALPA